MKTVAKAYLSDSTLMLSKPQTRNVCKINFPSSQLYKVLCASIYGTRFIKLYLLSPN